MKRVYRFLGIPVWSVEVYEWEEADDEEELSDGSVVVTGSNELSAGARPMFGFVDHKDTPEWEDLR